MFKIQVFPSPGIAARRLRHLETRAAVLFDPDYGGWVIALYGEDDARLGYLCAEHRTHEPILYGSERAAEAVAAPLQVADLDGWAYIVEPEGAMYKISIWDEQGHFVAYWGDKTIVI